MNREDKTTELFRKIYKNAAMGKGTTEHLLKTRRGKEMTECLKRQHAEYTAICRNAATELALRGEKANGLSGMEKARTDGAVSLNLLFRNTDSHVAQMMITGSAMGMVNAEKELHKHPTAHESAKKLMTRLSDFEKDTIEQMKPFL